MLFLLFFIEFLVKGILVLFELIFLSFVGFFETIFGNIIFFENLLLFILKLLFGLKLAIYFTIKNNILYIINHNYLL